MGGVGAQPAGGGPAAMGGCAVAKGSSGLLIEESKLSSKDQSVLRSSNESSRRDSGDPSRLELDVGRDGVSSEMVEQRGQPYWFWAQ